jgi:hypothetical protein
MGEETAADDDVLNAAELVQVRQDVGVQPGAEEPDWELIEKLDEIAKKDEVVVPDVPEAPDLDAVAAENKTSESPQTQTENNAENTWGLSEGEDVWAEASSEEE